MRQIKRSRHKAKSHSATVTPDVTHKVMSRKKFFFRHVRDIDGVSAPVHVFGVLRPHVGTYTVYLGHIDWPLLVYVEQQDRWHVNVNSATGKDILRYAETSFVSKAHRTDDTDKLIRLAEYGLGYEVIQKIEDAVNG